MSRKIELLSPAANAQTAIEAILHGADAVYIGGPSHGARKNAANSLDEIRRIVDFAHIFRAKVYVTVNTIIYPHELKNVERMIQDLYKIGVDALIVQDMGILRMDIPPIALHASTQCDNRTPEKARFLESVGFSQIVLARELTIPEIRDICESVTIPVETFVHGALCVSYSGRCHASFSCTGRSANRGECAQICRLPYDLTDSSNRLIKKGKHLLSLKDFNASHKVEQLLEAGVSSFKIEGRLKEVDYVKNITAEYNRILNRVIEKHPDLYQRSSIGRSIVSFEPQTDKSFNRGFTTYFLDSRHPQNISQPATPKSMGEIISDIHQLHNGDGISFFDSDGNYSGVMVNGIRGNEIKGNKPFKLPKGSKIHRTFDIEWQKKLSQPSAARHIRLNLKLSENGLTGCDERGVEGKIAMDFSVEKALKPMNFHRILSKLGNTSFSLNNLEIDLPEEAFIPASQLSEAKRKIIELLEKTNRASYPFEYRRTENHNSKYPSKELTYADNVANELAKQFYVEHGVKKISPALEVDKSSKRGDRVVMTSRHCILREMGKCRKLNPDTSLKYPLFLHNDKLKFQLDFDCERCEMKVLDQI